MDYLELLKELKNLDKEYKVKVIGKTKYNRKIFAVERIVDRSFPTAIFVASIHARENIATDLIFEMINKKLFARIYKFNLAFIVMANPDGVDLQCGKIASFPNKTQQKLIAMNNGSADFSMWKANANGVDLNNNFDANWETNIHSNMPNSHGYIGKSPVSELETKAIVRYTKKLRPFISISYHSKGEEIYFNFFQKGERLERDELIAKHFARSTGYRIVNVEKVSSGGYKDWCVNELKIPALTIELGSDELKHPIGKNNLGELFEKNKTIAFDLEFAYNEVTRREYK